MSRHDSHRDKRKSDTSHTVAPPVDFGRVDFETNMCRVSPGQKGTTITVTVYAQSFQCLIDVFRHEG